MNVEEFVKSYSTEYMFIFHKEEKHIPLSERISNFLFTPMYEVDNLNFKVLG